MRVLDTHTGEFVWLAEPEWSVYATVSHVWSLEGEQSYAELLEIQRDFKSKLVARDRIPTTKDTFWTRMFGRFWSGSVHSNTTAVPPTTPSILSDNRVSEKIRNACAIARRFGYRYLWLDSCCIDKSSSAELSEAINSMYRWYSLSRTCFVYLADVDHDDEPSCKESQFRTSKWHKRGWTLQEMIAPLHVVFMSRDWRVFGSKASLGDVLEEVTGVDRGVLDHSRGLQTVSVARRKRWAHQRMTSRVEDEAYCLMGIFGVHMTPIYGEGANAFIRLQEEILRCIPVQSIFAWGQNLEHAWDHDFPSLPTSLPAFSPNYDYASLLASSPRSFQLSGSLRSISQQEFAAHFTDPSMTIHFQISLTSSGVRVRLPILQIEDPRGYSFTIKIPGKNDRRLRLRYFALLACEDENGRVILLPLAPENPSVPLERQIATVGVGQHIIFPRPRWWAMPDEFYRNVKASSHLSVAEVVIYQGPVMLGLWNRPCTTVRTYVAAASWLSCTGGQSPVARINWCRDPQGPTFDCFSASLSALESITISVDGRAFDPFTRFNNTDGHPRLYGHLPTATAHLLRFPCRHGSPCRTSGSSDVERLKLEQRTFLYVEFMLPPAPACCPRPAVIRLSFSRSLERSGKRGDIGITVLYVLEYGSRLGKVDRPMVFQPMSQQARRQALRSSPSPRADAGAESATPPALEPVETDDIGDESYTCLANRTVPARFNSRLGLRVIRDGVPVNDHGALFPSMDTVSPMTGMYLL